MLGFANRALTASTWSLAALVALFTAPRGFAGVTSDAYGTHVVAPGVSPISDAVGLMSLTFSSGTIQLSGTLLPDRLHVLTAGHLILGANSISEQPSSGDITFHLAGGSVAVPVEEVALHPTFVGKPNIFYALALGRDLAVVRLSEPAPVDVPTLDIFRSQGGAELGAAIAKIGYGRQGYGADGFAATPDYMKRAAFNSYETGWQSVPEIVNRVTPKPSPLLLYDFDSGSSQNNVFGTLGYGDHEIMSAPGDSGGPGVVLSGGTPYIAGVTSRGFDTTYDFGLVAKDAKPLQSLSTREGLSSWGDVGQDSRVSDPLNQHFIDLYTGSGQLLGDTDLDGDVDPDDAHLLKRWTLINGGAGPSWIDLNLDGIVDVGDVDDLVHELLLTEYGDVNYDFHVDTLDEAIIQGNMNNGLVSDWYDGDINGDQLVTQADLDIWTANDPWGWEYAWRESAPSNPMGLSFMIEALPVPEPGICVPLMCTTVVVGMRRTRRRTS